MARENAAPIQVQKFLKGVKYPASKGDLIEQAKRNKADKNVISMLEALEDKKFNGPTDISKIISEED